MNLKTFLNSLVSFEMKLLAAVTVPAIGHVLIKWVMRRMRKGKLAQKGDPKVTALVRLASCCKCQVFASTEEVQICADSIMGLFILFNGTKRQTFTVSVDGTNKQGVMDDIAMILEST